MVLPPYVSKHCVKFERSRTICGSVIHDLAHFRRQIFHRGPNPRTVLRSASTEFHQTWRGHRAIIVTVRLFWNSDILLHFEKRAAQRQVVSKPEFEFRAKWGDVGNFGFEWK